jgi:hypothetical protein
MRAVKMLPLEETALAVKGPRADEVANAVVHRIAQHCCQPQEQKEPTNRHIPPGTENGVTTTPVSRKTTTKRMQYIHIPYCWTTVSRYISRWRKTSIRCVIRFP